MISSSNDKNTLQGFFQDHVKDGTKVYTDDHISYQNMQGFDHESVKQSVSEYVRKQAHTNGVESFWAMFKRAHNGVFHKMSKKHLGRYVTDFAGRQNIRPMDTINQMESVILGMIASDCATRTWWHKIERYAGRRRLTFMFLLLNFKLGMHSPYFVVAGMSVFAF